MNVDLGEILVPALAGGVLGYAIGRRKGAMVGALVLGGAAAVGSAQRMPSKAGMAIRAALDRVDLTPDADPTAGIGAAASSTSKAPPPPLT